MEENVSLSHFLTNVILPGDAVIVHCDNGKISFYIKNTNSFRNAGTAQKKDI